MKNMNENINKISPKSLLQSKWTKVDVTNKEKHFIITVVKFDEDQTVLNCLIEAVMTKNEYDIDWRELKDNNNWKIGWQ
ncbi:MAG: tryptophan-rich hypothetical protein [Colwellia sp.]|jgi:tryptophan-rich hypothetical protein